MKAFAAAWRFLTIIPWFTPPGNDEPERLRRSVIMFPLVGIVLGLLAACLALLVTQALPAMPAAALTVAALALFSGGFHLDGLADCGDALLSPGRDREKALAVMKDSRIGAHGAMTLVLILLLKFAGLAAIGHERMAAAAFAMTVAGRAAMLFPMTMLPYARAEGLGRLFAADRPAGTLAWGACAAVLCIGLAVRPLSAALLAAAAAIVVPLAWVRFLRRRLGGATGDCYGAACELTETAVAVAAAAKLHPFI